MKTSTKLYEVRFSHDVLCELEPMLESITSAIENGDTEDSEQALAEFVVAPKNVVIKREGNNTYAVHLSVDGVIAFAKEVAYAIYSAKNQLQDEDRDDVVSAYRSLIKQCVTALNSANKVLGDVGVAPIYSYFK
jgi:hypothetical protein